MAGSAPEYWQVQKDYRRHLESGGAAPAGAVRVALESNFTVEPLAAYLWRAARAEGLEVSVQVGPFDQYAPRFLDAGSGLYAGRPEVAFLFLRPEPPERAGELAATLPGLLAAFRERCAARLVVANFVVPVAPGRLQRPRATEAVAEANRALEAAVAAAGAGDVCLLDLDALAAHCGKERATDWKLHYLGGVGLSPALQERAARAGLTYVRLARRPARKCLVLDLDDTLWGGVAGELGPEGIALAPHGPGAEFVAFQRAILELTGRGVILAINSRNNPGDVLPILERHPHMLLRPGNFAAMRINWSDKAANMRELAAELRLGAESLVFLDNSPVERGWVKSRLPEVLVPELPADPALYAPFLEALDAFEVPAVTAEDRRRAAAYAEEAGRRRLRESAVSLDDYIRGLEVKLRAAPLAPAGLPRAAQMLAKTNQFNLTTRRHSEAELRAFLADPDCQVLALSVADVYGPSGVTGLAVLRHGGRECRIDSLLLSCRVLGRRIEDSFLHVVGRAAAARGARRLVGEYIPTARNGQVKDFYASRGFRSAGRAGEAERFELDLAAGPPPACDLHELVLEGFPP